MNYCDKHKVNIHAICQPCVDENTADANWLANREFINKRISEMKDTLYFERNEIEILKKQNEIMMAVLQKISEDPPTGMKTFYKYWISRSHDECANILNYYTTKSREALKQVEELEQATNVEK